MHLALEPLLDAGWSIAEGPARPLPPHIIERYPGLAADYLAVFSDIDTCVSGDEKSWFLTPSDFAGESSTVFSWNEWERQSLDAAEGDSDWQSKIVSFWDSHFPIYMSVRDGYEYAALSLNDESHGNVVVGGGPEYEDTTPKAQSLFEYIPQLLNK